jgi:D-glycero-alpha-D-manno-heptose-7-phosphate kinase
MIISKTPLRISFAGGGTDLPSFYHREDGAVLSTTIDKCIYVIIKERFDDLIYVNWMKKEIVEDPEEIEHELVREALNITGIKKGVEITMLADIPSEGSGLGSSSSLTVGLLNAFYAFTGRQVSSAELAAQACQIEIEILGKPIGKQDQYAAAYGGLNVFRFQKDDSVDVSRIGLNPEETRFLGSNLLLFFTNQVRKAQTILVEQKKKIPKIFDTLLKMKNQVTGLKSDLENGDLDSLGKALKMNWDMKRTLVSAISNKAIDRMYEKALQAGAIGGKVCGAGGGGFLLLYVPRESQNSVRSALSKYRELPFMLDRCGSRIIFNHLSDYWK